MAVRRPSSDCLSWFSCSSDIESRSIWRGDDIVVGSVVDTSGNFGSFVDGMRGFECLFDVGCSFYNY